MGSSKSKFVTGKDFKDSKPFLYYFSRSEDVVYYLSEDGIEKKKFEKPVGFFVDSGIGFINDLSIMIVGGSDRLGRMKRCGFIIDMDKMFVRTICKINFPCKEGSIINYLGSIYYVGSVCLKSKQDRLIDPVPGPLFKYMILENTWQVLSKSGFSETIDDTWSTDFPVSQLYRPGNFIIKNTLYYIGGTIQSLPNQIVYTLDLSNPIPKYKSIKFRLPINLISPVCSSNSKFTFICGGYSNDSPNKACLKFVSKHGFKEIPGKDLESTENFPPKLKEKYLVYCAFPKFALRTNSMKNWKIFNINGSSCMISLLKKTNKHSLPPISNLRYHSVNKKNSVLPINPENTHRLRDSAPNTQILHISYSSVNTKHKKDGIRRNNSPENSGFNSVFSFKSQDAISIEDIVSKDNDHLVSISKKSAIKIFVLVLKEMDSFTMDPLLLHQVSYQIGLRPLISIDEIYELFNSWLKGNDYSYVKIKQCTMNIYKNCKDTKVRTSKLNEILEFLQIPEMVAHVSKDTCILILTRMMKALMGQ